MISFIDFAKACVKSKTSVLIVSGIFYACCQLCVLVFISNIGTNKNPDILGDYIYALALVTPIYMFTNMNLRLLVSTEKNDKLLHAFFVLRKLSLCASLFICLIIAYIVSAPASPDHFDTAQFMLVSVIALMKFVESIEDFSYGVFQYFDTFKRISISLFTRGFTLVTIVYLCLANDVGLEIALGFVTLLWMIQSSINISSYRYRSSFQKRAEYHDIRSCIRTSIPLGISNLALSLMHNLPRYYVDSAMGREALGILGALQQITKSGFLIVNAFVNASAKRATKLYKDGQFRKFIFTELMAVVIVLFFCFIGFIIVTYFGGDLLLLVSIDDDTENILLFTGLIIVSGFSFITFLLNKILTLQRNTLLMGALALIAVLYLYVQLFFLGSSMSSESGFKFVIEALLDTRSAYFVITLLSVTYFIILSVRKENT